MAQMGMDVEAVDSVGRQLKQSAASVDLIVGTVDKTVSGLSHVWDGADAQRLIQSWPNFRKSLVAAQASIAGLGQSALNNASEQRQASSAHAGALSNAAHASTSSTAVLSDQAQTESSANGNSAHVVSHPDGKTTATDDASDGLHGSVEGTAGLDGTGTLAADGTIHGEAGVRASETNDHALGGGTTFSDTYSSFAGADGTLHGSGSLGLDGAKADIGGTAFAGSQANIQAQLSGGGVTAGIGAGVLAGIGAMANANVQIGWDHIGATAELGLSVGVGLKVNPSFDISPKEIVDNLLGVHW